MRGALTGGLGVISLGLIWVGLEGLFGRFAIPLGFVIIATGLTSAGLAFSASHYRLHAPWGFAVFLGILGLVALGLGIPRWYASLILLFAVAYAALGLFVHHQRHPHHFRREHVRT